MEDYKLKYLKYKKKYLSLKSQIGGGRISEDQAKQLVKDSFRTPQKYEDVIKDIMHYGYSRESAQIIFMKARSELEKEMDDMAIKNSVETASEEAARRAQGEAKKSSAERQKASSEEIIRGHADVKKLIRVALITNQKHEKIIKDIMTITGSTRGKAQIIFIQVREELQREAYEAAIANSLVTAKEDAARRTQVSQGEAKKFLAERQRASLEAAERQAEEDFRKALELSKAEAVRSKLSLEERQRISRQEEEALAKEELRRVLELSETDK